MIHALFRLASASAAAPSPADGMAAFCGNTVSTAVPDAGNLVIRTLEPGRN
jgi:hypothetical protein